MNPEEVIHASPFDDLEPPEYQGADWKPLDPQKFWEIAGPIKTALIAQYPEKVATINAYFPCRVLGVALERAVLESFDIEKNEIPIQDNTTGTAIPDGMTTLTLYDINTFEQPNIIEVKGRFSTSNPEFDYLSRAAQYTVYRNYLVDNSHLPYTTISHGLYLILPDGVTLSEDMLSLANLQNIPIMLSGVEIDQNEPSQIRVKVPEFVNVGQINREGLLFDFLPDTFVNWARGKLYVSEAGFRYQKASLELQQAANDFANSYLEQDLPLPLEECPD